MWWILQGFTTRTNNSKTLQKKCTSSSEQRNVCKKNKTDYINANAWSLSQNLGSFSQTCASGSRVVFWDELQLLWWMWPIDPQKPVMQSDNWDENVNRLTADCIPECLTQLCPFPTSAIGRLLIATLDNSNWIVNEMKLSAWPSLQFVLKGQFSQMIL